MATFAISSRPVSRPLPSTFAPSREKTATQAVSRRPAFLVVLLRALAAFAV